MTENSDVFKKACLLQLSTSMWQCTRVVHQSILQEKMGQDIEWLKGRKYLINPELLGPVNTAIHQARNAVLKFALPFPITSIYLIPKDSLSLIDEQLSLYKTRFWDRVDEFEALYEVAREEARDVLKDLFNETDYPMDIRSKFKFVWRFLTLQVPDKAGILSPELYEREKRKFQELMDETRELAVSALREEFGDIVNTLVEKLGDAHTPKMLSSGMFNKMHQFIDDLGSRNIFQDEALMELTHQAKAVISGTNAYSMKHSGQLRKQIHHSMAAVKAAIDHAIEDMPRRKLRIEAIAA